MTDFDPTLYNRAPVVTLQSGITLARALVEAMPKSMPAHVSRAAKKLMSAADSAQTALGKRQRADNAPHDLDGPTIDHWADNGWGALEGRIAAYARLPEDRYPLATRSIALHATLFGSDKLKFTQGDYPAQLASMETLLERIKDEKLAKEVEEVAGKDFLDNVRKVMPPYRAVVKEQLARDATNADNLIELLRGVQRAIVHYATCVCGTVDEDEHPGSAEVARHALQAIQNLRHAPTRAPKGGGGGTDAGAPPANTSGTTPAAS